MVGIRNSVMFCGRQKWLLNCRPKKTAKHRFWIFQTDRCFDAVSFVILTLYFKEINETMKLARMYTRLHTCLCVTCLHGPVCLSGSVWLSVSMCLSVCLFVSVCHRACVSIYWSVCISFCTLFPLYVLESEKNYCQNRHTCVVITVQYSTHPTGWHNSSGRH